MALFKLSEVSEEERKKYLQSIGIDAEKFQNAQETKIKNEQKSDNLLPIETKNTDKFPVQEKNTTNNFPIKQKSENDTVTNKKLSEMVQGPSKENNNSPNRFNFRQVNQTANKNENKQLNAKVTTEKEQEQIKKAGGLEYDTNAIKEAMEINKDNSKGNINSSISHVLNGVLEGAKSNFAGVGQSALFPIANALRMAEEVTGKKQQAQEKDNEEELWSNKVLDMADYLKEESQHHSKVGSMLENNITRDLGNISNTVGNMAMSAISNVAIPGSGIMETGVSAGGNSAGETLNEDRSNLIQAIATGTAKGAVEGFTEKITGGNMLGKGSLDDLAENIIGNRIKSKAGKKIASKMYEFGGEILEEQISNNAGYVIDKIINNKDLPSFEQWINEANETTKSTFLTTLALNMLGMGGSTYKDSKIDIKDEQAQKYLNEAQKIIDNENIAENIKNNVTNQYNYKNTILSDLKASNLSNETKNEIQQYLKENNITEEQFNEISETLQQSQMSKEEQSNINSNEIKYQYEESDNEKVNKLRQEIINKAQQIEKTNSDFQGLADEIKNNYLGKDFDYDTYKQMNEYLDDLRPKEKDILEITTFNDSVDRRKTYMKYKNDTSDFNSNEVNLALDTIKANRNDKRTVSQWKKVAEQIGEQLAVNEKTAEEVENTAFKSWFDLQPTKNITRYDNQTKSNLGFQKFTADDWVNTIYKTYNEQTQKNVKQIQDNTINQTQQTIPTNKVERIYENTPGEEVNYTEMERPNGKIRKHYRSIIESSNTTAEAKKIAKELMGVDTYVKTSNKYNTEIADRNIETNGPEKALTSLTTNVNDNKKITAVDIATGERLIEYFSKIGDKDRLQEAIQTTAMAGTEAGQAVQAMSLLNHQTPQGQVVWIQRSIDKVNKDLAKRNKNGAQFDFTPEMQQKILNSTKENLQDNINEVYEELGKQVPKSHIEQLNEWRYFSMLANPKTHIRNIVGNLVMGKVQDTKNKIAGGLESVFLRNSDERNHTIKRASKEVRQFAKNDIKNVESELGLNDNKYNPKSRLQNAQRTFKSNILENTLGKAFDFNSKLLEAEDGIGLKSAYTKALAEYITANKLDINNISDKDLQKARNYAIKQAQEATFHQECQIASMLNTLENKNKVTQVMVGGLIPFKKTPMNVAITGYQYSPLGLMTSLTKGSVDLRKGKITANQYIDNISKGLTGTGIALLGYALTEAGILKASGGDDDKEKFEEQQGKQSYSIQIGDNTYSLDWLAPAGIPLFIGSELYQIGKAKEENGEVKNQNQFITSLENIANAGMTAMNPMSEMSMVSGLVSTLKSYAQDPMQGLSNTLVNMGKSYVNQMFPTALGQVSKTLDDKERSTTSTESGILTKAVDSTKNQIMSKIPGLRQMLPVATDVWGNEKEQKGNYIDNAVFPWNKKEITTNSTDKALTELYDKTGESSVLPDSFINKTLTYDKQKYRLTDQEYAELKKEYGKTSYAIVSGLTKSSEFNNMSEEQQVKAVSEAYKYAKAKIKSTYANWNDIDTEDSTAYKKVQDVVKNGGDAKDYFLYVGQTLNAKKEKEKIQILKDSDIGSKKAIYESTIGNDDKTYSILDNTSNFNIKDYLDYKLQDFSSDKEDDGTINGKTVSGSAKNKFYDYMDDSNFTYDQKLLLTCMKYKVTNTEREKIFDIIDDFNISKDDKLEIMSKMKGFTVYNNGRVSF